MDRTVRAHGTVAASGRPLRRVSCSALGVLVALLVSLGALGPNSVSAATGDVGFKDFSFSGTSTPTGTKRAESVLWWNDGSWWADMWSPSAHQFHIYRLDLSTQTWVDSGVAIDTRSNTHADVLWDGTHLYVASHAFVSDEGSAQSGSPSYLFRFSYDAAAKRYSLDSGFPVQINNYKTETLVIDKDSTGKLWATWQQGNQIYVNRTVGGDDHTWGTPFALPATPASVTVDDSSAVIAFGGNKIGVMWSNQTSSADAMYFAVHNDGDPDTTWQASRTAIQGPGTADDHINLKSLQSDGSGRVYAAVKTSFTSSAQPLIMLLVRDPASGDWSSYPIARVSDCPNRPIVVIDEENRVLHSFFTAPSPTGYSCNSSGGAIYEKTSPLDAISFPLGYGTLVIRDAASPYVYNVSSTKQNVNSRTGIALLAVNAQTSYYWHAYEAITPAGPPTAPVADFSATPTSGTTPLTVSFTDLSSGSPTNWAWNFGDGGTSTQRNPTHTYSTAGSYTVIVTVSNDAGSDTKSRVDYISATPPPPDFILSASPTSASVVRGNSTVYTITVTSINAFTGPIDLSVSGLPAEATGTFDPDPVTVPPTASSTLTVATTPSTKQGAYTLTVTGVAGTIKHSISVSLQIKRR